MGKPWKIKVAVWCFCFLFVCFLFIYLFIFWLVLAAMWDLNMDYFIRLQDLTVMLYLISVILNQGMQW